MRILMIAPEQPHLNTIPEIRIITQKHHVTLLNGVVTVADVYSACRMTRFQIIHFATHSNAVLLTLSSMESLTAPDIAQLDRMTNAECIFFNSCLSGKLASYCISHGAKFAVYSNIDLPDAEAWKFPAAFYDALSDGHGRDVVSSFAVADSGDGEYGLAISPELFQKYVDESVNLRTKVTEMTMAVRQPDPVAAVPASRNWTAWQTAIMAVTILTALGLSIISAFR